MVEARVDRATVGGRLRWVIVVSIRGVEDLSVVWLIELLIVEKFVVCCCVSKIMMGLESRF